MENVPEPGPNTPLTMKTKRGSRGRNDKRSPAVRAAKAERAKAEREGVSLGTEQGMRCFGCNGTGHRRSECRRGGSSRGGGRAGSRGSLRGGRGGARGSGGRGAGVRGHAAGVGMGMAGRGSMGNGLFPDQGTVKPLMEANVSHLAGPMGGGMKRNMGPSIHGAQYAWGPVWHGPDVGPTRNGSHGQFWSR